MGTRGFLGFHVDGRLKIAYNHADSYPERLGVDMLHWLTETDIAAARDAAARLRLVRDFMRPTAEDVERLSAHLKPTYNDSPSGPTWYELLHGTMGDPEAILNVGVMRDADDLPVNPTAAWGYLIDFDTARFEVYRGYQRKQHTAGRFWNWQPEPWAVEEGLAPARLVAVWPLDGLPGEEDFVRLCYAEEVAA